MKCDNCDRKGMCEHALLTHDDDGGMIELEDRGHIRIGINNELSIIITRCGDTLKIEGPFNNKLTTAILTNDGLKTTMKVYPSAP